MLAVEQDHNVLAGELIISSEHLSPQTLVGDVFDRFSKAPALEAMALVDSDRPAGLITRSKLFFTLSHRFGYELHGKHPIISIADTTPLVVAEADLLDVVIERALARPQQDMYDEIVVIRADGSYLGLLSVKQLVIQQSNALTRSVLLKEMATARAQELERLNQVKSQFLANVTHELRSPVNAIIGLAELLRMAAADGSIDQIRERLSLMISTAANLRAVITNILNLSKLEAGKMEVTCQEVDLGPILAEIAQTTRVLVGAKPVVVTCSAPDRGGVVETDPIKLRQIVMNLASNAAKFTEQGSIALTLSCDAGSVCIEVGDTGIGIREEHLDHIFTAFGQVEDAATKMHEGTGLGLTITQNLVKLLGGSLTVTSTYGEGATFRVTLPRKHETGETHHDG